MNMLITDSDLKVSARNLDDRRLIKQILECYQIIKVNERVALGEDNVGYRNHPVIVFYRDYPDYVIDFGLACCKEYTFRFGRIHAYDNEFTKLAVARMNSHPNGIYNCYPEAPIYVEGKTQVSDITSYDLFMKKMLNKWHNDRLKPKWTRRISPRWYDKVWRYYVDDMRTPSKDYYHIQDTNYMLMRLSDHLKKDDFDIILVDLDHDAGDYRDMGGDYINILKELERLSYINENYAEIIRKKFRFRIHSSNVVGVKNMRSIIIHNRWREVGYDYQC